MSNPNEGKQEQEAMAGNSRSRLATISADRRKEIDHALKTAIIVPFQLGLSRIGPNTQSVRILTLVHDMVEAVAKAGVEPGDVVWIGHTPPEVRVPLEAAIWGGGMIPYPAILRTKESLRWTEKENEDEAVAIYALVSY